MIGWYTKPGFQRQHGRDVDVRRHLQNALLSVPRRAHAVLGVRLDPGGRGHLDPAASVHIQAQHPTQPRPAPSTGLSGYNLD